ncbi:MAG: thioredoxin-dependent thiol peroxidase [Microcystis wesenbergii Mw_QC_S_20081001_S30D]|jgi:peroxiredoxin Q/BCP|uniref:thioredoxin-dependent peroxiredoxin n=1 Tax=Microcystis wesenbergii Mw_QC_S_20081001_S30D TaxID=2486245 RepID=A0A552JJN0_9CHRO|nr:thioredoxin-dependent thiol peroxidase [Microcystis aeruginosa W11-03]NCR96084.1 thioredoxin-dependent thiol peroxidase [Microcystis aeruginosa W11-06]TRU94283.1 MAG: thioredoxin-dependent thiol peroxidase [Microcystis wesenbergii Mw_QC_B_20070930_S4D]TRU95990.1 MAG: thioredoxin-dependent thiol peroxidase [Microcystis wesenbergii Mw_QC_S_20081001_S30D]TRU99309.1 MAG: thioredoxin-dependent thiol peroxidase [Microcystis wesenbergii Mw_QC_S_20081001_S30]TRV10014.1 MAG: thioredoxin-dependent th
MTLEVGQKAPEFASPNQRGEISKLADFAGQWLVLYFYPKDNTPGCSTEAIDFTALSPQFQQLNAVIIGVSPDSEKSHCRFIEKHNLTIQLLSDTEHQLAEIYQVWGLKKFMGKEYMGIKRSTFLIDPQGNIAYIWSNVKVKAHAEAVLKKLEELQ